MNKLHAAADTFIIFIVCLIASLAFWGFVDRAYGVTLPQGSAVFETSLQSRISAPNVGGFVRR